MNPNPPINQASIGIYQGNAATVAARLKLFADSRANLRKWHLPTYARLLELPAYETQMKAILKDAFVYDVVMGRALRTVPAIDDTQIVIDRRRIYDERNMQAFSLIIRTFTTENSGDSDSSGAIEDQGHALWLQLVEFNYGISDNNIPNLKVAFYDSLQFRQKLGRTVEEWAAEVRSASTVLISNGHPISEKEKNVVFRKGLIREDMQQSLIFPALTETFEQLVIMARSYAASTLSSSTSTSQRVFYSGDEPPYSSHCFLASGRKLPHSIGECRKYQKLVSSSGQSNKRSYDEIDISDIDYYRCGQKGHYLTTCPNPPVTNAGRSRGRGGRNGRGRGSSGRGGRSFNLWDNDGESDGTTIAIPTAAPVVHAPPPAGYVPPPQSHYFSGALHDQLILICHRNPHRWIFDTGCTSHSAYLRSMFSVLNPHDESMFAANGNAMTVGGIGDAGPFSKVLFLPDLQITLFSQKQAMKEGASISLSADATIYSVLTRTGATFCFVFDGTFWVFENATPTHNASFLSDSSVLFVSGPVICPNAVASISHSGAVHEFLLLHFRLGHMHFRLGHFTRTPSRHMDWISAQSPKCSSGSTPALPSVPADEE